ncbi:glycogenin-2 isoform X1 [Latimeria chalumnae]|uniref:glycogenin glucosyltransferase n=1 Tax=Latimeria chalumnae TaxID=7897 RepID=H3AE91_LATCH|nr:PREDICTED: glycogenin-2 isoform X3 [Latimeria chalumnae]|eukprot:XP_005999950.1 PREDICTED: glycogenin-2 isoform X3 [Latimeria chalumnae]
MSVTDQAFVTLGTNDVYCQGALVLEQSLRAHKTSRQLAILITPDVSSGYRTVLHAVFDEVVEVNMLDSKDTAHLALMKRPELGVTFTKLHCWTLTQYRKCVFLDADSLVLCNIDELFDREELSAAPDAGWPDCFNTGMFVFRPSLQTYSMLLQFAEEHGSFDGGDQGLLNSYFSSWATQDISKHLSFLYNLSSNATYTYLPAFRQFGSEAKVIHFLGAVKPWQYKYNPQTGAARWEGGEPPGPHCMEFINLWWQIYSSEVVPLLVQHKVAEEIGIKQHMQNLSIGLLLLSEQKAAPPAAPCPKEVDTSEAAGLAASISELSVEDTSEEAYGAKERQNWEEGHIDYMGKDAFENIQKKLDRFLQ